MQNVQTADTIYFWSIKHQYIVKLSRSTFQNNRTGYPCELCIPRYQPFMHSKPCRFRGLDFDQYRRHIINSENYYKRSLVWCSLNDIPTHDLERAREIGHLKSLEKAPILRVEFFERSIVKRRSEILDYFKRYGCHCKDHLGVQCRVKCDQFISLFSHLKHMERESYRQCVFEATPAELNALNESNAANRAPLSDNLTGYSYPRAHSEQRSQLNDLFPTSSYRMPNPTPNSLVEDSNDTNDCPLAFVECVLNDQSEERANDCRVVSIYKQWKAVPEGSKSQPSRAPNSQASTSLKASLQFDTVSNFSMMSSSSSDSNETRSRMMSHLYEAGKKIYYTSSVFSDYEMSSSEEEEASDEADEKVGLRDLIASFSGGRSSEANAQEESKASARTVPSNDPAIESPIDLSNPSPQEHDDLEVVYRSCPIKREVLDDYEHTDHSDEQQSIKFSKRFKIDYEGCIVID